MEIAAVIFAESFIACGHLYFLKLVEYISGDEFGV
jgi:hypothetical protein